MPPAGGSHGAHGIGGPGPGIHGGGGPRGGPPGGGHPGGRAGPMSRSGGIFSGAAHVAFGGQGILGHIFGTRATANTGTYYDSPEERYVAEYIDGKQKRRSPTMSQSQQPSSNPQANTSNQVQLKSHIYLMYLSATLIGMSVIANIMGAQMWKLLIIPLDCGIFVYPIIYVTLDVINEVYKLKFANRVALLSAGINFICIAAFWIAGLALKYCGLGADGIMVITAFKFSTRVFVASTVASLVSTVLVNNPTYQRLRRKAPRKIGYRAFISSFFARILDSILFTVIGFYGRVDGNALAAQFLGSLAVALVIELFCTPVKVRLSRKINANLKAN